MSDLEEIVEITAGAELLGTPMARTIKKERAILHRHDRARIGRITRGRYGPAVPARRCEGSGSIFFSFATAALTSLSARMIGLAVRRIGGQTRQPPRAAPLSLNCAPVRQVCAPVPCWRRRFVSYPKDSTWRQPW